MDKKTEKTNSACSCPCAGENGPPCAAEHNSSFNREAPPGESVFYDLSPSGDVQETGEAYTVVGVRFKRAGKIYYFDPADLRMQPGTEVIVETARGLEYGYVMVGPKQVSAEEITQPLKKVIRIATEQDRIQLAENKEKEKKAFTIGLEKISQHKLEMKLIDVEYTFDRNKIIFYFTADGRIDFRELVKDLASVFKTRIELRQIGVRDEAKMIGGLGVCGRSLCCATFLGDFEPVSIKMAKEQNLSLNPTKISGICGRLMCCLKFESDSYREAKNELPAVGTMVSYQGRKGRVIEQDLLRETLVIAFSDEEKVEVALGEVEF
ncbi:MAG TPA: stage 0 sporulation family protein [Bacillota bacterium]